MPELFHAWNALNAPVLAFVPGRGIRPGLPNLALTSSAAWLLLLWRLRAKHTAAAQTPEGTRLSCLLWQLPATVMHEAAHWLAAWLLLARPSQISVWPSSRRRTRVRSAFSAQPDDGLRRNQAGHVVFEANAWTTGIIALAPLWLLMPPCLLVWLGLWVPQAATSVPACTALGLLLAVCWQACWPSAQDWSLAVRYPAGSAILALAGWAAAKTLG